MELNDKELVKSLTSLIDETLEEIEEIKKSKYAASEVKIEGPGDGIAGKPTNGELDAKKKEDEDDDEYDEDDEEYKKKMKEKAAKGENEKADEDHGKFAQAPTVSKDEAAKGENEKADEDHGKFAQAPSVSKKEYDEDDEEYKKKMKKDEDYKKEMKKSYKDESESLMKSYVDTKFSALEDRLSKMAEMMESIADAPVERKGVPAGVKPLHKSADHDHEPLTKSQVADKLFELKKSGTQVDSSDIFSVETSKNYNDLMAIANKYGVK